MSRCFPFPPPGYEKKARAEDEDLLKKEKQREKKHKKEKKDKEKKEKKEKDKSEGKDREKKEKKERDKKKDKDLVTYRDKNNTSDEKKLTEKSEDHHNGDIFGKREKDTEKGDISLSNEKIFLGKAVGDHGEKLSQNTHLSENSKNSRFVQELGRRISNGAENHSAIENFMGTDRNKEEKDVRLVVAKDIRNWSEGKEKQNDKNGVNRRMVGQRTRDEAESSGNTMRHNLPGIVQGKSERMPRPLERNIENKMEGNEKTKKEGSEKQGDNHTDKDRERKSKDKDKNRDKGKKKEEKMKLKESTVQKIAETDRLKENHMTSHSNKVSELSKDIDMADAIDGNLRKRKDLEANGFCDAIDVMPNKLPRLPSSQSSHTLVENGRVTEPCQIPLKLTSDRQVLPGNHVVDKKKQKVNGVIEGHSLSESSMKPTPSKAVKVAKNGVTECHSIFESSKKPTPSSAVKIPKSSIKPPHPDSKYLEEILSVPKMEEWADFDDQEWLLKRKSRPKARDSDINETPQVWDAALRIDSADICALPYVIPY